jgi:hypothetical protein
MNKAKITQMFKKYHRKFILFDDTQKLFLKCFGYTGSAEDLKKLMEKTNLTVEIVGKNDFNILNTWSSPRFIGNLTLNRLPDFLKGLIIKP